MEKEAKQRLSLLRERMREVGVDAYLVPTDDFHASEYVGEYFKCRRFLTGFTGSAGTALVTQEEAFVWTDGRYFLQAERELSGSGFALMRMGEEKVPTLEHYLEENLKEGQVLGFDGRCISAGAYEDLQRSLSPKGVRLRADLDLVGEIWKERPALSAEPAWELGVEYCGQSRREKLEKVRAIMEKAGAELHLLTSLDDIAWLLNLRGGDVHCNPVVLSYLVLEKERALLFANKGIFSPELIAALLEDGVELCDYEAFYSYVEKLERGKRVFLSKERVNSAVVRLLSQSQGGEECLIDRENPTVLLKACKNPREQENMKKAHVVDGAALTRLLHWVKENVGELPMDECSVAEKLYEFRSAGEHFLGNSFDPIVAYKGNAANPHYSPAKESCAALLPEGLLLLDTGGQYYEGTTDVTRTIALGPVTQEEKKYYTLVLKGHLALSAARFKKGSSGVTLDILARSPLWEIGEDYNHGTGHGVGYCLNVHEGPQRIHYMVRGGKSPVALLEGMITSNEPGYYRAGEFGIRHENLVLVTPYKKTESGEFYQFENLTMVPFDLEALDLDLMTEREIELLNAYHARVREALSPLFTQEERHWLTHWTRPVSREGQA